MIWRQWGSRVSQLDCLQSLFSNNRDNYSPQWENLRLSKQWEAPTRNSGRRLFLTFLGIPAVSHSKSRRASSGGSRSFTRLVWASNLVDPSRKEHRTGGNCSPREDHSVLAQKFLWRMGLRTAIVDTHIHDTHAQYTHTHTRNGEKVGPPLSNPTQWKKKKKMDQILPSGNTVQKWFSEIFTLLHDVLTTD